MGMMVEVQHLLRCRNHPNILGFYGVFINGDCLEGSAMWCMLMEYCAGGDLCHMLRHTGRCSEGLGATVLHSLLSALAYIHAKEVVHRDVKGENVLIGSGPRFVLSDFSIATHLSDKNSLRRRCGSPGYVAPEILMGESCCRRSDIFSLGVVMHLVLVGRLPFAIAVDKTRRQPVFHEVCFGDEVKNINKEMIQLIQTFLAKQPKDRPTSAKALQCMPNGVRDEQALAKLSLLEVPSPQKHSFAHSAHHEDSSHGGSKSSIRQPQMSRIQKMRSFLDSLLQGQSSKTAKIEELNSLRCFLLKWEMTFRPSQCVRSWCESGF